LGKLDIICEVSIFTSTKRIRTLCHAQPLIRTSFEKDVIIIPCVPHEPICKDCIDEPPFCFFYETLFTKLSVWLPLHPFEKEILLTMKVTPTQLHPNSWVFVRAFHILCGQLNIVPSSNMFFYFFEYKISKRTSWAKCYEYGTLSNLKPEALHNMVSSWPFAIWGMDIINSFIIGKGQA